MRTLAVDPKRRPCCRGLLGIRGDDIVCADCAMVLPWVEVETWAVDDSEHGRLIAIADGHAFAEVREGKPGGCRYVAEGFDGSGVALHTNDLAEAKQHIEGVWEITQCEAARAATFAGATRHNV